MVDSTDSLITPKDAPQELVDAPESVSVMGTRVISAGGEELGVIADLVFETGPSPMATGYKVETDDGAVFIPLSAQLALSGENLVLPVEATAFIRNDLAGFGAAVIDYRKTLENS